MLLIETELGCHERTEAGDSLAVAVRVRIFRIHGAGKGIRKDLNVAELLRLCNSGDFHDGGVDEGALADPLGLDEREVRATDKFILLHALLMACDARREIEAKTVTLSSRELMDSLCEPDCLLRGGPWENDREFVPAETVQATSRSDGSHDRRREELDLLVSNLMAVAVVYCLEPVEIEHHQE